MNRGDIAREAFLEGYNCSQCMMVAFHDLIGIDKELAVKIASPLGGGMGRLREVCGAVSGMFLVLGYLYGYSDPKDYEGKKRLYAMVQELAARFKAETGTIICRELLGLEGNDTSSVPSERTKEYYERRPCPDKIALAANILAAFIERDEASNY